MPPPPAPRWPALLPTALLGVLLLLAWQAAHTGPDVVVYGGTPQGVTAAVAAARQGLRVTLIEPGPQLGGVVVRGWLATLDDTNDRAGHSLYGGLYADVYRRLGGNRNVDARRTEQVLWTMLRQAGVDVRVNTPLAPGPDGVRRQRLSLGGADVTELLVRRPLGSRRFRAPTFIDATDTAELAVPSGAAFTVGREDSGLDCRQMAAGLIFRLGGVDWAALGRALNDEQWQYRDMVGFDERGAYGFGPLVDGYTPHHVSLKLRGLNIARQQGGTLLVNALLISGVDGTRPADVQRAYRLGAAEVPQVVAYLQSKAPGVFGHARLLGVAPELYLRETRHLLGVSRLHADDALMGRAPGSSVAVGGYPLDGQIYDPREAPFLLGQPAPYGVPFGTLVPRGLSNLLVVSQAASFDSAAAFSARVVPLQMELGEVAGTAAAVAARQHVPVAALAGQPRLLTALRGQLRAQGVRVPTGQAAQAEQEPDDALAFARLDTGGLDAAATPAVRLLRRGLMSAPYSLRGDLGEDQPVLVVDFLASLDHWLTARSQDPAQQRTMDELQAWARTHRDARLTWATGRAIFLMLHEDAWEFENKRKLLTRGEMARLLTDMFPAADRQEPRYDAGRPAGVHLEQVRREVSRADLCAE